jgi:hypothetical protein
VSLNELPKLLADLCNQPFPPRKTLWIGRKVKKEIDIAAEENAPAAE